MQRATAAVVLVVGFGGLGSAMVLVVRRGAWSMAKRATALMVLALSGAAAMGWALLQVLRLPGR